MIEATQELKIGQIWQTKYSPSITGKIVNIDSSWVYVQNCNTGSISRTLAKSILKNCLLCDDTIASKQGET